MTVILILVYLIGYTASYFLTKMLLRNKNADDWVMAERFITMILSLLSWLYILIIILAFIAIDIFKLDPDKKAKW